MQVFGEDQSYVFMPLQQDGIVDYTVKLYKTLLAKGYNSRRHCGFILL